MRFYLVPKIGDGVTPSTAFRAKYAYPEQGWTGVSDPQFETLDYGLEPIFLLAADTTAAEHTEISGQADVISFPTPLNATISALALDTVKARLESIRMPSDWVTTTHTYRQVLVVVARLIRFFQRYRGLIRETPFAAGVTLDTPLNQMTAAQRQALATVADNLGIDRSDVVTTMTLRQVLLLLANRLSGSTLRGEAL